MNKKIAALVLALGLMQVGGMAVAEPAARPPFTADLSCLRHNGNISPGVVPANQRIMIHGPYTSKCGKVAHIFHVSGGAIVEQLVNGSWRVVADASTINHRLGSGTFRVMYDNKNPLPHSYRGFYSVPL
jgi:hypothetical protein